MRLLIIAVEEPLPELDGNKLTVQRLCELPSAEELGRAATLYEHFAVEDYQAIGQRVIALIRTKIFK